jgi:hypothetical protein
VQPYLLIFVDHLDSVSDLFPFFPHQWLHLSTVDCHALLNDFGVWGEAHLCLLYDTITRS